MSTSPSTALQTRNQSYYSNNYRHFDDQYGPPSTYNSHGVVDGYLHNRSRSFGSHRSIVEAELAADKPFTKSTTNLSNYRRQNYNEPEGLCTCKKCRDRRGDDITTELLPMDAQIPLQTMMQDLDADLICAIQ